VALSFGIFDHVDRGPGPLADFYENRLKLIEAYDRAGFYIYLVAEHHSTPLGMAPSPSVFLSAVAQRTKRLRFGPLVYTLPLYHPLRLIEEICMLDQMSGGRLEFGVGKGISPIENRYYGLDPAKAEAMFGEAFQILLKGLAGGRLTFKGEFYNFENVPMEMEPVQKPHPPLWYGANNPQSAERCGLRGMNTVANAPASVVRGMGEAYWPAAAKSGMASAARHEPAYRDRREPRARARDRPARLSPLVCELHEAVARPQQPPVGVNYPEEIDGFIESGLAAVGTPGEVRATLAAQLAESGANYLGCRFAFGDLTLDESLRSLDLFTREVMPHLARMRGTRLPDGVWASSPLPRGIFTLIDLARLHA
jgi:alkanesulfonate monooxygenase SsuD/methylene tetrahydromethanopterin reductase-like flavin-dependent oxidoreductase (luciferase family)